MKRAVAIIMCAAMIVMLLAVSTTPVAAAASSTGTITVTGATVNYIAKAGYNTGNGKIWGYISATLKSTLTSSASLILGAGVRIYGYTFAKDTDYVECSGYGGTASGGVFKDGGSSDSDLYDIALRIVVLANNYIFGPITWPAAAARCWTWHYNQSSLTPDNAEATKWRNYALSFGILMTLSNFMGPYW